MPRLVLAPGWPRILAFVLPPLAALGAVGAAYALSSAPAAPDAALPAVRSLALPAASGLLVYVSGAVGRPGLYRMTRGERVYDAVQAAGGLVGGADPAKLPDMAQRLRDGQQVKVPYIKGYGPAGSATAAAKVDLNQATYDELMTVPGFTPDIAQAAVEYRSEYGGFASVKELVTVLGMDYAAYMAAKPDLKV